MFKKKSLTSRTSTLSQSNMSVFKAILFFVVCFLLSVMFSLTFSLCGEGLNLNESLERKHLDSKRSACCWASHIYLMLTSWSYLGVRSWEWRGCFWSRMPIFSGCFGDKQLKAHSTLRNCEISTTEMHFAFCLLGQQASMCPDEQPELALFFTRVSFSNYPRCNCSSEDFCFTWKLIVSVSLHLFPQWPLTASFPLYPEGKLVSLEVSPCSWRCSCTPCQSPSSFFFSMWSLPVWGSLCVASPRLLSSGGIVISPFLVSWVSNRDHRFIPKRRNHLWFFSLMNLL